MNKKVFTVTALAVVCAAVLLGGVYLKNRREIRLENEIMSDKKDNVGNEKIDNEEYPVYVVAGAKDAADVIVRKDPSDDAEQISSLSPGDTVEYMGEAENGYAYISKTDLTVNGYAKKEFFKKGEFEYSMSPLNIVDISSSIYSYEEMENDMAVLSERYSDFSAEKIAQTADKRNIYKISIGTGPKKVLFYGGVKGTDYMTSQLLMKQAEYYLYYADTGTLKGVKYSDLLKNITIDIIPMLNPDGIAIAQGGAGILTNSEKRDFVAGIFYTDRDYGYSDTKKNVYYDFWQANANGVDISLNFPIGFNEINTLKAPSARGYKGASALSEVESRTLSDIIDREDYCCIIGYNVEGNCVSHISDIKDEQLTEKGRKFAVAVSDFTGYLCTGETQSYMYYGGPLLYCIKNGETAVEIGISDETAPPDISELRTAWDKLRELPAFVAHMYLYG